MAKSKSSDLLRIVCWMGLGIGIVLFVGGSCVLYSDTLIDWWKPVTGCAILAVISALIYGHRWERFTCTDFFPINFCIQAIVGFSVLIFAFFSVNYFFSDDDAGHTENVTVERRYRETRYRTKRIGRRVVGRGTPYYVYFIEIRFSDGRLKSHQVLKGRYDRIHQGDTMALEVSNGFLDIPVIKTRLSSKPKQ